MRIAINNRMSIIASNEASKKTEWNNRLSHLVKYIKKYSSSNYKLKKHKIKTQKLYFDTDDFKKCVQCSGLSNTLYIIYLI